MKNFKAFIKHFKAQQRSVKKKKIGYTTFRNARDKKS